MGANRALRPGAGRPDGLRLGHPPRARSTVRHAPWVALLVVLLALGCARRGGDVVLITVDTLRADYTGLYGYPRDTTPRLARFFASGARFERAYATSSYTSASLVSVLSGLHPQGHRVRLFNQILPESVALLPDWLAGWQSAAVVSNGVLSDALMHLAGRFDYYDDDMPVDPASGRVERRAGATTDAALAFLATERDPGRRLFLWVHYMDPHRLYTPPDEALAQVRAREAPAPWIRFDEHLPGVDPLEQIDRYAGEIAYVDGEIGRLLDALEQQLDLSRSLVLFTADHGESLAERRRWFEHAVQVFEEQIRVPLLLRAPGVAGGVRRGLASGIDIAPTVLAFAGVPAPEELPGRDLREPLPEDRVVFAESIHRAEHFQLRTALQGTDKWFARVRPGPRAWVDVRGTYDLEEDPREITLPPWRASTVGLELLGRIQADPDPAGLPRDPELGAARSDVQRMLEALGYLEESDGSRDEPQAGAAGAD